MRKFAIGLAIALTPFHTLPTMGEIASSPASYSSAPRSLSLSQRQTLEQIAQMISQVTEPDARVVLLFRLGGSYYRFNQIEQANASWQQALATTRTLPDSILKAALLAKVLEVQITVGQKEQAEQLFPEFIRLVQSLPEPTEHSQPVYTSPFTMPEPARPMNSVIEAYANVGDIDRALQLAQQVHEPSALRHLVHIQLGRVLSEQKRYDDAIAIIQRISAFRDPETGEFIANPTADQILQTRVQELLQFGSNIRFSSPDRTIPPESHIVYRVAHQWIEQITDPTTRLNQQVELVGDRDYQQNFGEEATANLRQLLETIPTEETVPSEERARLLTDLIPELRRQNPQDPLVQQSSETLQKLIASLPETETGLVLKAKLWRNLYCGCGFPSETARRSLQTILDAPAWNATPTGRKQKAEFLITLASARTTQPSDFRRFIQQATEIASALSIGDRTELLLKIAKDPLQDNPAEALTLITPLVEQAQAIAAADRQQSSQNLSGLINAFIKLNQLETAAQMVKLIEDPSSRFNAWAEVANAQIADQPEVFQKTALVAIADASSHEVSDISQKLTQVIATYIRATSVEEGMKILVTLPSPSLKLQVSRGLALYQGTSLLPSPPNGTVSPFEVYWRSLIPQLPTVQERDREWVGLVFIDLLRQRPDAARESIAQIQAIDRKVQGLMLVLGLEASNMRRTDR
jgi:tetratricopeptide (TPR) repeat protein